MPDPTADTVALWVSRDLAHEQFRPLSEATVEILGARLPAKSAEELAELYEQLAPKLPGSLDRLSDEMLQDGIEPHFELQTEETTAHIRTIRTAASDLVQRLIALEPHEFEQFCARVLNAMGGRCTVVGKPGDGGVDFVAQDLRLSTPAPIGARVTVLGQAKRYGRDNLVSENELRQFVGGSLHLTSNPDHTLTFRRAILAPAAFAFWTTSDFHPSAKKFARNIGLWYLNGLGLAQLAIRLGLDA